MNTKILKPTKKNIICCAELIKSGEVVGMPTETVYGLAANAFDEAAVKKIFKAKKRPADNPLIVHIADIEMLRGLVKDVPDIAIDVCKRFWPGPLTVVLPKSDKIPSITSGGLDTVGIRLPSNEVARELIRASGLPLAAPSANLSGSPSPTTAGHVYDDLNGRIPAILDGGKCSVGVESTVISFESDIIRLLRPGRISVDDLKTVTTNVIIDKGVLEVISNDTRVKSPGMKYKHYSPKADVTLIDGSAEFFERYVSERNFADTYALIFDGDNISKDIKSIKYGGSSEQQAERIFAVLREIDKIGAKKVYARCPSKEGIGLAVYNRMLRAAGFKVIKEGD